MTATTPELRAKRAAYMREWTRKNKDRLNAQRKAKYAEKKAADPEGYRGNQNVNNEKYYKANREQVLARQKENNWYYDPDTAKAKRRKYYEKNWKSVSLSSAKKRARDKGLPFDLDMDWIDEQFPKGCAVTGLPLDPNGSKTPWTVHLDRVVPELGYTKENTRMVCACYNLAKRNWSDSDVLVMAQALVENKASNAVR